MKGKVINRHAPLRPDQKKLRYLRAKDDPLHGALEESELSKQELDREESEYAMPYRDVPFYYVKYGEERYPITTDADQRVVEHEVEQCLVTVSVLDANYLGGFEHVDKHTFQQASPQYSKNQNDIYCIYPEAHILSAFDIGPFVRENEKNVVSYSLTSDNGLLSSEEIARMGWIAGKLQEWIKEHEAEGFLARFGTAYKGIGLITMLMQNRDLWVRSILSWHPDESLDSHQLIMTLISHLFCCSPLPPFLHNYWLDADKNKLIFALSVLLGQNVSLQRASKTNIEECWVECRDVFGSYNNQDLLSAISRISKLKKYLHRVPHDVSVHKGFLLAEVFRSGGTELELQHLINNDAFCLDMLDASKKQLQFFSQTVGWLARNRNELEAHMYEPILEWAMHRHSEGEYNHQAFSWKRRTVRASYAAAQAYQGSVERRINAQYAIADQKPWKSHGWNWKHESESNSDIWTITELTSVLDLIEEGDELRHCVSTYGERCLSGRSAIFSLQLNGKRLLTIELVLPSRQIVQVRGKSNREPTHAERDIIRRWHRQRG